MLGVLWTFSGFEPCVILLRGTCSHSPAARACICVTCLFSAAADGKTQGHLTTFRPIAPKLTPSAGANESAAKSLASGDSGEAVKGQTSGGAAAGSGAVVNEPSWIPILVWSPLHLNASAAKSVASGDSGEAVKGQTSGGPAAVSGAVVKKRSASHRRSTRYRMVTTDDDKRFQCVVCQKRFTTEFSREKTRALAHWRKAICM